MSIQTKKLNNLPSELIKDIHKIAIGKNPYLIGSGSITSITYNSDFDLNEKIIVKDLEGHVQRLRKEKNIWILSVHNTKEYIQINTICNINGVLTDVNDTIFVHSQPTKRQKEKLLKEDIHELISNKNYFKAVKRMYSLLILTPRKNISMINYLTNFLNSNIGLLSSIVNQLNIIKNFYSIEKNQKQLIINNLELCKLNLNKVYCVKIENELFKMFNIHTIDKLISILDKKLQDYVFDFLNINKKLFKI
jgi:hypothetical protein